MAKIKFEHLNLVVEASSGTDFLEFKNKNPEIPLKFGCRRGDCGVCAIQIIEGQENLTKQSAGELATLEKKGLSTPPYRLACQCAFNGDVTVV